MDSARRFNLKATFRNGQLLNLEPGDFGQAEPASLTAKDFPAEDCFLIWPTDPRNTGWRGIACIAGWSISDDLKAKAEDPSWRSLWF